MGYKKQRDYERAGIAFFNGNDGKLYYSQRRNRYYKYDKSGGQMATVTLDGTLHHFSIKSTKEFYKIIKQDELYEL